MIEFDPRNYPKRIVLVGAGGTGAQWARSIARILWDMRARNLEIPEFVIVDPDVVEEKNVGRQLFTRADCGHFKAEILARRLSYALGLNVQWINGLLDPLRIQSYQDTMYCGAVDNHEARKSIQDSLRYNSVWIDAGNHENTGQVIIGNTVDKARIYPLTKKQQYLPLPTMLFPSLLEPAVDEPAANASCAELMQAGAQHLLINDLMATVAAGYTHKILNRLPVTSFITYVDIETLGVRSLEISGANLQPYIGAPEGSKEKPRSDWPARHMEGDDAGLDEDDDEFDEDIEDDEEDLEAEWGE